MKNNNISFLKKFHIIPKIFCVLVAFVIWLYVAAVESPDHEEVIHQVPVTLVGVSSIESNYNLSVFSGYDLTVDLNVRGQRSSINKYSVDDYHVTADISNISKSGRYSVDLTFDMPSGVTLSSSSVKNADIYIDERTSSVVNVVPKIKTIAISDNYELGEVTSDTQTIVLSGPKTLVDDIDYAAVYLNAGNISSSTNIIEELTLVNRAGEDVANPYLKLSKSEVRVSIPVYEFKELNVTVPTKYGYFNDKNAKITVYPQTIAIKGDPVILSKITSISTNVIDETKFGTDTTMILGLQIPDGCTLAEGEVPNVSVSVSHIGTSVKSIIVDDIKVKGAKNIEYSIQTASINIKVRGSSKDLEKVEESDIEATIDLSGYAETTGTISVPVTITVKNSNGDVYAIGEYSVQVKIS